MSFALSPCECCDQSDLEANPCSFVLPSIPFDNTRQISPLLRPITSILPRTWRMACRSEPLLHPSAQLGLNERFGKSSLTGTSLSPDNQSSRKQLFSNV